MSLTVSNVSYTTDAINGDTLTVTIPDTGWVEYTKSYCRIYASKKFPENFYLDRKRFILNHISKEWPVWPEHIGFINHLSAILQKENFIMPVFGLMKANSMEITCGSSRFAAHVCSGGDPDALGLVILTNDQFTDPSFVEINSTAEFNEFYNLNDTDYRIGMVCKDSALEVQSSVLRHTFYNAGDPLGDKTIAWLQNDIKNFWIRYQDEETKKLKVKIHCRPEHRKFINAANIFDITFIDEEKHWGFSHGKLLGAFRRDDKGDHIAENTALVIWLFDISEPFDLALILPTLKFGSTCIYTENKKAVMFDPTTYNDFKIIGNIVK